MRLILDEFANIGQIPNFDKLIATIRSREISASIILQSQSQLKSIYKDAADIISDNCDCTLFLSGRGKNAKEISDALGRETIDSYNTSENRGSQTSHGLNYGSTDEINVCRFAPEISAGKEENRRNPDGFQDFLTQSSGNLWREAVCGDFISGSLSKIGKGATMTDNEKKLIQARHRLEEAQARDRVKQRKARTRRLIQEGAVLEKALPQTVSMSLNELETYLHGPMPLS